jgi:hypothetical protein
MKAVRLRAALFTRLFCVAGNPMLCPSAVRAYGVVEPYSSGVDLVARAIERNLHGRTPPQFGWMERIARQCAGNCNKFCAGAKNAVLR